MAQFISRRPPAFRVCLKCSRRGYQMPLMAPDEVHGLCAGCVATIQATDADPMEYLQSHLPRTPNRQPAPTPRRPAP